MIDGIIKADGTSRLMRAELPTTYEEFRAQCHAGVQPLDVLFNAIGWSQLPTFLNKANLLKDTTATLFGLDENAVPNDVFGYLGKYSQHWWQRRAYNPYWDIRRQTVTVTEDNYTSYYVAHVFSSGGTATVKYSREISIDENGVVSLVNPSTKTIKKGASASASSAASAIDDLVGCYCIPGRDVQDGLDALLYIPDGQAGKREIYGSHYYWYFSEMQVITTVFVEETGVWQYVQSTDRNAYPDSGVDGTFEYEYLGVPFDNAVSAPKMAYGSYNGTGKAGVDNPTVLTFGFVPKIVFISQASAIYLQNKDGYNLGYAMLINGVTSAKVRRAADNVTAENLRITWSGNSVSMYHDYSTPYTYSQFNSSSQTYYYLALG